MYKPEFINLDADGQSEEYIHNVPFYGEDYRRVIVKPYSKDSIMLSRMDLTEYTNDELTEIYSSFSDNEKQTISLNKCPLDCVGCPKTIVSTNIIDFSNVYVQAITSPFKGEVDGEFYIRHDVPRPSNDDETISLTTAFVEFTSTVIMRRHAKFMSVNVIELHAKTYPKIIVDATPFSIGITLCKTIACEIYKSNPSQSPLNFIVYPCKNQYIAVTVVDTNEFNPQLEAAVCDSIDACVSLFKTKEGL